MSTTSGSPPSTPQTAVRRVHMIGIGGAGMSALARLYLQQGLVVTGSDTTVSRALDDLHALGADTYVGSDTARVAGADLVVFSSAVPQADPELSQTARLGIRALKHAQALGELFNTRRGVAVAGTHGKTTTTSMIAFILERCGVSPSFQIGGVSVDLGTSASWGRGEWMVIEADEFDRRFLEYRPEIAVVTNVEPDHFEYYGTYEQMRGAFADFLRQVQPKGTVVACGDDPRLAGLLAEIPVPRVLRYGIARESNREDLDLNASNVELTGEGSRFTVTLSDEPRLRTPARLRVLGEHNVLNALAAIGASSLVGVSPADAAEALSTFRGAERRFQLLADADGTRLFEDYAHHPTEVRVNLEAARRLVASDGRLWAVFQPHLLTRTEMLFDEFTHAFDAADVVVIADVYSPAGREPAGDYRRSDALVRAIAARGHKGARHVPSLADIRTLLARELRPGDVVLVMGAGNVDELGRQAASDLKERAKST